METAGYEMGSDSAENSMERRLKIENAATGIALMSVKLSGRNGGGKNASGNSSQGSERGRTKMQRRRSD